MKACQVEGCVNVTDSRLCPTHRTRWRRSGSTSLIDPYRANLPSDVLEWMRRPKGRHAEQNQRTGQECGGTLTPVVTKGDYLMVDCDGCGLRFPPIPLDTRTTVQ